MYRREDEYNSIMEQMVKENLKKYEDQKYYELKEYMMKQFDVYISRTIYDIDDNVIMCS